MNGHLACSSFTAVGHQGSRYFYFYLNGINVYLPTSHVSVIVLGGVMESHFVLRSKGRTVSGHEKKFNMAAMSSPASQGKRGPDSGKQER